MSVYPRYVPHTTGDRKWDNNDINAVVDHVKGGAFEEGFLAYHYGFLIRDLGDSVYDAINKSGQRIYGGPSDTGSVDGGDCDAVIQAAINILTNGGLICFQRGYYPCSTPLTIPYAKAFKFKGEAYWLTNLEFASTDGFTQNLAATTPIVAFEDLAITKAGAIGNKAIAITGTSDTLNGGFWAKNLYIYNFNDGIEAKYCKESIISECEIRECLRSVSMLGKSVSLHIDKSLLWGNGATGSKGVNVGLVASDFPEGLMISNCTIGKAKIAVNLGKIAEATIMNSQLDNWHERGIEITETAEDIQIVGNWIHVNPDYDAGSRAINFNLDDVANEVKCDISANSIRAETCVNFYKGQAATINTNWLYGTYGVRLGANSNIIVTSNKIRTTTYSIDGAAGGYNIIADNRVWATISLTGTVNKIHDNIGYNPVGNIATPYPVAAGNLEDVASVQAFPTSNVDYTVSGSPKLVTIYGGTVTSIVIDGVTCGLTSGAFFLQPGQIIRVVWSGQPNSVVYAT